VRKATGCGFGELGFLGNVMGLKKELAHTFLQKGTRQLLQGSGISMASVLTAANEFGLSPMAQPGDPLDKSLSQIPLIDPILPQPSS
jgi:hypothetical protein